MYMSVVFVLCNVQDMSYFLQKDLLRLSIYFCKFFFFCRILNYEFISLLHRTDCNSLFNKIEIELKETFKDNKT